MHCDCDLCVIPAWIPKITPYANHLFPTFMRHEPYQSKVIVIIQGDKLLHLRVLEVANEGKITLQDRSFCMGVEQFLKHIFVRRLDRSEENLDSIFESGSDFVFPGIRLKSFG